MRLALTLTLTLILTLALTLTTLTMTLTLTPTLALALAPALAPALRPGPGPGPDPYLDPNPHQVQGGVARPSRAPPVALVAAGGAPPTATPAFDRPPQATWAEPPVELPAGPASVPGGAPVRRR